MVAKDLQKATGSPKVEVGEIDTRAPFQSVKDAVTLFGEGAFSGERPGVRKVKPHSTEAKSLSAEKLLAEETQLHLAKKELHKLQAQLQNAETTKAQALTELELARKTAEGLELKLLVITRSKELALKSMEDSKHQAKELEEANHGKPDAVFGSWKEDLEIARVDYMTKLTELDTAKKELRKIRQESDASLEAKVAALKLAAEAEDASKANGERASVLSKDISSLQESITQVKLASAEAQQEQVNIFSEKEVCRDTYKAKLEETSQKVLLLKKELEPMLARNLELQLANTLAEAETLEKEIATAKASDLDSVQSVTSELDDAKESLQKVADEEICLRSQLENLKLELESVKKEHIELKEKEAETESIAGSLHFELRKGKSELDAYLAEEAKARGTSDEMISTLKQLSLETDNARQVAEEMKIKAEELKKEVQVTKITLEEAESKLAVALEESEEAKMAELRVLDQIRELSERTSAARASTSESGASITISKDEFDSLSRKVEESDQLAEMRVAAAMAQVEAVKASENEALKKLEATQKEIDDMKAATAQAVKRAEMAEAAKKAVEGELRRWREREQKKAAETASRILAETEKKTIDTAQQHYGGAYKQKPTEKSTDTSSPHHYRIYKQNPTEKILEARKREKEKSGVPKRALVQNLSGIFQRKKNQVEGGSPSYLPGEKLV